jgi:hypothetical protein
MKTTKLVLLFYNSILIFTLITIGLLTQEYNDLTPILLLIPVWAYYVLSIIDKITKFSLNTKNRNILQLIKLLRVLKIYSLIIVFLIVIASLAYSSNFFESTLSIIFLPPLILFGIDIFNKTTIVQLKIKNMIRLAQVLRNRKKDKRLAKQKLAENKLEISKVSDLKLTDAEIIEEKTTPTELVEEGELEKPVEKDYLEIQDFKRRQFLKIVGGGGVSLFLMLFVFQQKASAAFFGSGGGPGIVALKDTSGTKIDPAEKQPTDGYTISEIDDDAFPNYYGFVHKSGAWYIAKEESTGAFRYYKGASDFSTGWANRVGYTYGYFDDIFS